MINFTKASWLNEPRKHKITIDHVEIVTEPSTDFWQRSYYGFRNNNAPALLLKSYDNFSFTVKSKFEYKNLFDQCGLIIYLDSENWFKASIEYENSRFSRLGSVVTNKGYSDWATTDIELPTVVWYRLSRRGPDFLIEYSFDGFDYRQMRIFHLHQLGDTSVDMGKTDPPIAPECAIQFGVYACSPLESSFTAVFSEMHLDECLWQAHGMT
jgi:regulation of enolase protein 1 (concanavalin A-like superfamily)